MKQTQRKRSGPVYLESERGTVSLVFEADVREVAGNGAQGSSVEVLGQPDIYVIDGDGVRLLRRENRLVRAAIAGAVTFVLLWAIGRLLGSRSS